MRLFVMLAAAIFLAPFLYGQTSSGGVNSSGGIAMLSAPQLPQAVPSVVYPNEALYPAPTSVANGANLQTSITNASCGTILDLAANGSWAAGILNIPNKSCACHTDATKWLIIRAHAYAGGSVRGTRVDPSSELSNLATITSNDANYTFYFQSGAGCVWFLGLNASEITNGSTSAVAVGDGSFAPANYPHDVVIDHSYIHGLLGSDLTRCVAPNGNWITVVDSYISDCHKVGQDSQGIGWWDGYGPWLIQNNFIEGSTENIISGGADPQAGVILSDLTVTGNHIFKPLSWRQQDPTYVGIHYVAKNLFELKGMNRCSVTKNVMENSWVDGQAGQIMDLKANNQNGNDLQSAMNDCAFSNNIFRHMAQATQFNTETQVGSVPYAPPHRISFSNDLWYDISSNEWGNFEGGQGGTNNQISSGSIGQATSIASCCQIYDFSFNHETWVVGANAQGPSSNFNWTTTSVVYPGMSITNSVLDDLTYGAFFQTGNGGGNSMFAAFLAVANLKNNCIVSNSSGNSYSNGAFSGFQQPANQAANFTSVAGNNYTILSTSPCHLAASDGTDMGANIAQVNYSTAGVVHTLTNLHTVTNISPSTFTHLGSTTLTITGTNFTSDAQVVIGGAGPSSAVSTVTCATNTCTVVMSSPITLAVNDTVNIAGSTNLSVQSRGSAIVASVTDTTHFTYTLTGVGTQTATGGTANRVTTGNLCTSVSVTNSTTITCTTPAATGAVLTGPVSVFVSQWGIPVQSTVFGNYN